MVSEAAAPSRPTAQAPEIRTPVLAAAASLMVIITLAAWAVKHLSNALGDTDDALRLVLFRELANRQAGWWDQHLVRLQPPYGMDLHWSRLIDGGLAMLDRAFGLVMSPSAAELATRVVWPLIWVVPVVAAAIAIARSLKGATAAMLCAILIMVDLPLFSQWYPGRIDHHNVQIALALVAAAGAVSGGRRGAWVAGIATGFGLAVGVEGLLFEAAVGAGIALRWLFDPAQRADAALRYGAGLAITLPVLFLIQTPPTHWFVSYCDAAAWNLVAGAVVAGSGLLAAVRLTSARGLPARLAALALVGGAAGAAYALLLPACLGGPLAQADPRIWPIWLSHISEMQSLFANFPKNAQTFAIGEVTFQAAAAAGWLWLGRRREGRTFAWGLIGACFALGVLTETQAMRMAFYAGWFATPLAAAAAEEIGAVLKRGLIPPVLIVVLVSGSWPTSAMETLGKTSHKAKVAADEAACSDPRSFQRLAELPPGVVLSEIDLGPYVLATTRDSVIAAPYHRMAWGIVSADQALSQPPGRDEAAVRALGARYVLACPAHRDNTRRIKMPKTSLQRRLDFGHPPAWLKPMSPPGAAVKVYEVWPNA